MAKKSRIMLSNFLEKSLLLVMSMGSCVAVTETVYGNKGASVILICPYKSTPANSVLWAFLNNTAFPVPISDGTSILPLSSPHPRAFVVGDHTAGVYNLNMSGLQESDEGVYRCTVGSDQQQEYKLEFSVLPSSLTFQDVTTGNKILGTEGQSLTLRCTATGGKPPPLVTITVGNVPRSAVQFVEYNISLQREHDQTMVQCNANISIVTPPLDTTATLYLNLKPLQPIFSSEPGGTEGTKPLVVSCTSTGSRPAATFHWSRGGTNVTSDSTTEFTKETGDTYAVTSTLTHNVDRTYNNQTLTCTAVNIAATNGVQSSKILDVKFAPSITVKSVNYTQNIVTRTVTCNPNGNPPNYTYYRWQHKSTYGELIRELVGGQNGVLTLPIVPEEASYQDSGEYVCTASNNITDIDGRINRTGSGYVTVHAQPVFTSGNNHTEYGEFGKDVEMHVYVYSVPKYTFVMWSKSNAPITFGDKYNLSLTAARVTDTFHDTTVKLDGYRFTLTIKNLLQVDFNVNYSLELSNGVGKHHVAYTVLLLSSSGPQTPENFTISSYSQSSISIQWYPGNNGGYEQTFFLQYRVYGSNPWGLIKISDSKQTENQMYTLTGLQDGTSYELRMYAENRFNKSLPTQTERIETIQESHSSKMGPIIGGVAGGLVAVLIVIAIIWFMIFKRKQDTHTPSKASRSKSESEGPVPKEESVKKSCTSMTEYAEVQKPYVVHANVNKTVQQKNLQDKKQIDKKTNTKKPGKIIDKAVNNNRDSEYANSAISLKDMSEGKYANAEDRNDPITSHNQQGLEYADLSFTKHNPQKVKKPIIHGGDDRTLYSEVDHSKKAPTPPQESAYEETNFKHS